MSEPHPKEQPATDPDGASESDNWTEKRLPPVKPPTAGLLVQLFLVPMIIVSIIVGVWLMFGWLAEAGTNPQQLISNLEQLNKGSWQDAHRLSNMLRDPRETELRQDSQFAARLSETLVSLVEAEPDLNEETEKLAIWLCSALGQFDVDSGLTGLIRAMSSDRMAIRRAAVQAVATLAGRLKIDLTNNHPNLVAALAQPAQERTENSDRESLIEHGQLRLSAAFALGIVGGAESLDVLALMLSDPYPDVRYNAATGLARHGDARAERRLLEMISLDNPAAVEYELDKGNLREWKQNLVILNGLRAIRDMYSVNASSRSEKLSQAVETLRDTKSLSNQAALVADDILRSNTQASAK